MNDQTNHSTITPIDYIARMLEFHADHPPYRWWREETHSPLAQISKPLHDSRLSIVALNGAHLKTEPAFKTSGDSHVRTIPQSTAKQDVHYTHFAFKRERVTPDPGTLLPLWSAMRLCEVGKLGSVTPVITAFGSQYSQRLVQTELVPAIIRELLPLTPDIALIVPACPLDHQTAAILSREIESFGIAAIVASSARDISLHCGSSRVVYVHAPIGWMFGMPHDAEGQVRRTHAILEAGMSITDVSRVVDLPTEYPLGLANLPTNLHNTELDQWEDREFKPGYLTE